MSRTSGPATRQSLIDSGVRLLEEVGLGRLSIDEPVRRAGVAKGTFYVHFPDRAGFLLGIHRDFHDRLKARVMAAIQDLPRGRERLCAGTLVYLDGCLAERGVKALLFEARTEAALREEVSRRNADFARIVAADFQALRTAGGAGQARWRDASASGRLFVAMAAEAAQAELEAGKRLPAIRRALAAFLD